MSNDNEYPSELIIITEKTPNGIAWGIRDNAGQSYQINEAKQFWFAAIDNNIYIDSNLTFLRLVGCDFDPIAFDEYINNR